MIWCTYIASIYVICLHFPASFTEENIVIVIMRKFNGFIIVVMKIRFNCVILQSFDFSLKNCVQNFYESLLKIFTYQDFFRSTIFKKILEVLWIPVSRLSSIILEVPCTDGSCRHQNDLSQYSVPPFQQAGHQFHHTDGLYHQISVFSPHQSYFRFPFLHKFYV